MPKPLLSIKRKKGDEKMNNVTINIECYEDEMDWIVLDSSHSGCWHTTDPLTKKELETILRILHKHLTRGDEK